MTNQHWTLTVSYNLQNGTVTVTDDNGDSADETIYTGETDTLTFKPGSGVSKVTGLRIGSPSPLPQGVSVTWAADPANANNLIVTDIDSLISTDQDVQVSYCVLFNDSRGNAVSSDPKLINKSSVRPSTNQ